MSRLSKTAGGQSDIGNISNANRNNTFQTFQNNLSCNIKNCHFFDNALAAQVRQKLIPKVRPCFCRCGHEFSLYCNELQISGRTLFILRELTDSIFRCYGGMPVLTKKTYFSYLSSVLHYSCFLWFYKVRQQPCSGAHADAAGACTNACTVSRTVAGRAGRGVCS